MFWTHLEALSISAPVPAPPPRSTGGVAPAAGLGVKQDAAAGRLGVKRDADAPALASVSQTIASAASSDAVSQKNEAGPNHGKTLKRRRLKEVE